MKASFTEAEYLALEKASDHKHEFVDGAILAIEPTLLSSRCVLVSLAQWRMPCQDLAESRLTAPKGANRLFPAPRRRLEFASTWST
jgi:hypothetical protein